MQLPVHQFNFGGIRANIPLAAGYLKAIATQEGLLDDVDIEILDPDTADLLGDAGLIENIVNREIDILGITCYCWNVTRSLYIARELKKRIPWLKVVVGGPEITPDNPYILSDPVVDIGIINEGEKTFLELLRHFSKGIPTLQEIQGLFFKVGDRIVVTPPRPSISNLAEIPSPYLTHVIGPSRDRSIWIETVRGCRFHCEYCYYYKMFTQTLAFPMERLAQHLEYARENEVREVYIMDPTFNDRADLYEVCETIRKHNLDRILSFHTELRADLVDEKMADLFAACNFKSVEVGLQSVNSEALKNVGRRNNLERFLKGVHLLKERNIHVMVGIIIGLPGDNFSTIVKTVEFLVDNQAYSDVQVFNLSVLPGTVLRTHAEKLGLKYQSDPPYYVLETETMSGTDLRKAQEYCAEKLGITIDPIEFPSMTVCATRDRLERRKAKGERRKERSQFPVANLSNAEVIDSVNKIILELNDQTQSPSQMKQLAESLKTRITNCFTVWFKSPDLTSGARLMEAFLFPITTTNPHVIFNIILETDNFFPLEVLEEILAYAANPSQFLNSYYLFCSYEENLIFSTQITVLLPLDGRNGASLFLQHREWLEELEETTPVIWNWNISPDQGIRKTLESLQDKNGVLIDFHPDLDSRVIRKILQQIKEASSDDLDRVLFRDAKIQQIWDREICERYPLCEIKEKISTYNIKLEASSVYLTRAIF